jgi:glycosyltransferase involved in cell wall biosynthesis
MNSYQVTLNVTGRELDFAELNRLYGTHLDDTKIAVRYWDFSPIIWDPRQFRKARKLRVAALVRTLRKHPENYDVYVSAANEMFLPAPHLQYIHFPQRHLSAMRLHFSGFSLYSRIANELVCRGVMGQWRIDLRGSHVLTNSGWTRNLLANLYGVDAEVVYPPVCIPEAPPVPWMGREFAFVTVGRFHRQKRFEDAIYVVDRLRLQYPDLKLHVVGFGQGSYRDFIVRLAESRTSYVSVNENVSREYLGHLMATSRFGIHCTTGEHFGMAPAELTAYGCLVFVPNSGGQVEIVNNDPELVFGDVEDCYRKAARQLAHPEKAEGKALRYSEMARTRFGAGRFMDEVRNAVWRLLDRAGAGPLVGDKRQYFRVRPTLSNSMGSNYALLRDEGDPEPQVYVRADRSHSSCLKRSCGS